MDFSEENGKLNANDGLNLSIELLSEAVCRNFNGHSVDFIKDIFTKGGFNIRNIPVKKLIENNLNDQNSRNLMILTKNDIALQLLFGSKLLDEMSTTVLIGSEFAGDKSELYLIQQINEIKSAMATGSIIILLNHDSIYESLYDVLNQRYSFNVKDGITTKMLRLAIGAKSQLCPVKEGFRIIVIIDKDHAYNDLDLPLLNRFEKQVLVSETMLLPKHQLLLGQLTEWVNNIMKEINISNLNEIFCGYDSYTLSSLILTITNYSDNFDDSVFEECKTRLAHMTLPIAAIQSNILKNYTIYSDFSKFITEVPDKFVLTFTRSPLSHLSKKSIILSEFSTENQLIDTIENFAKSTDTQLMIQCDLISCTSTLVNHARYICVKLLSFEQDKQIIFVIHLPNGISQRTRWFSLNYYNKWEYYFIDDVSNTNLISIETIVSHKPQWFVEQNIINLRHIIQMKYPSAVNLCTAPYMQELEFSKFRHYAALLSSDDFIKMVENYVFEMINQCDHLEIMKTVNFGGTFRQNMFSALDYIIINSLASLIRQIDQNFNTRIIDTKYYSLWYILCKKLINIENSLITNNITNIYNSGKFGILVAKYPFSLQVIKIIESFKDSMNGDYNNLDSVCRLSFGDKIVESWNCYDMTDYLHDYVASIAYPHLKFDLQLQIYITLLRETPLTVENIHKFIWQNEGRIFQICSICSLLPDDVGIEFINSCVAINGNLYLEMTDLSLLTTLASHFYTKLEERDYPAWVSEFMSINVNPVLYRLEKTLLYTEWMNLRAIAVYLQTAVIDGCDDNNVVEMLDILKTQRNTLEFFEHLLAHTTNDLFVARYIQNILFGHLYSYSVWKSVSADIIGKITTILNNMDLSIPASNIVLQTMIKNNSVVLNNNKAECLYVTNCISMLKNEIPHVNHKLNEIINLHLYLIDYAQRLMGGETSVNAEIMNNNNCKIYVLKYIRYEGGYDMLAKVISIENKAMKWLVADRKLLKKILGLNIVNPLPWVAKSELYEKVTVQIKDHMFGKLKWKAVNSFFCEHKDNIKFSWFVAIFVSQISISQETVSSDKLEALVKWSEEFFDNSYLSRTMNLINKNVKVNNILHFQLFTHVLCESINHDGIFNKIIFNQSEFGNYYIPSIADDEFISIIRAFGRFSSVGWYKCKNGHPYTVGNCTQPMMQRMCTHMGCFELIGGLDHVSAKGNTRIEENKLDFTSKPGYIESESYDLNSVNRAGMLATMFMRLILHTVLKEVNNTVKQLDEKIRKDIKAIMEYTNLSEENTYLVAHMAIDAMAEHFNRQDAAEFLTIFGRNTWENYFEKCIDKIFKKLEIEDVRDKLQDGKVVTAIHGSIGFEMWTHINEQNEPNDTSRLWKVRKTVNYDEFCKAFGMDRTNEVNFPILNKFIKTESSLAQVKYIVDILAWHAILFENVANITRQEAQNIKNCDVIMMLPESRRQNANEILANFCEAFNNILPQIAYLFECTENPFININGLIDLSGTKRQNVQMSPDTTINFSLPSSAANDAPGLCTIKIINRLERVILDLFPQTECETMVLNYTVPSDVVKQNILFYDRKTHLLPILIEFCGQQLNYGDGTLLNYDFKNIQDFINNTIFVIKKPVLISVRQFQYKGELNQSNKMQIYQSKIAQISITEVILDKIWSEIDTQDRLNVIVRQIEECVNFINNIGTALIIDKNTKLCNFVHSTFLKNSSDWSTDTIDQFIDMCHIKCLVSYFNEKSNGDVSEQLRGEYKEKLSDEMVEYIKNAFSVEEKAELKDVIYNLIVDYLVKENWNSENDMKQYLAVSISDDWFNEKFPVEIKLSHTSTLFKMIK
jgi:hypothetical protein